jgi:predicted nuclease of predicted toxin-antitoxin system
VSRFFVSLYFDEDVSVLIAKLIGSRGFSTLTARDAGQRRATDAEQLAFAAALQSAIVTHNRSDFEELAREYIAAGKTHAEIIIAVRRPP